MFWIKKTIKNVTIVVPVLITSCHVSENPNAGPEAAHTKTTMQQIMKATACPAAWETVSAIWPNHLFKFIVGTPKLGQGRMQFVLGVLIAIALVATLVSLMLGSIFGDDPMFVALGQTLAIVGAATFAWWLGK